MSIRLRTLRPPITTLTSLGMAGSGSGSGESSAGPDSSELLQSLLILSVDESEERVDEQLDDLFPVASGAALTVSESVAEDGASGELADGLSTSSVGVVGGEDGFCGFHVKKAVNKRYTMQQGLCHAQIFGCK